ncbi:MAG: DUF4438 domain-containing protein [Bacteroidales bacterium]|nr:DUF4438 domain-containing protein [Candidatus Latescibacterota bacterium]
MLRTNKQYLIVQSVLGAISQPRMALKNPYLVDSAGNAHIVPGTGGITYNVSVGDSALDFRGDHVEPGVSLGVVSGMDINAGGGLSVLTCVGNEVRVVSGDAVGCKGIVTGKHGGVEHVLIDFPASTLEKLVVGDKVQIKAFGQGLEIKGFAGLHFMNLDPTFLVRMNITTQKNQLIVPVTHVIPASVMGSGLGSRHSYSGDYDIQLPDREAIQKFGLQNLRIGDIIAINDADCRFGRTIRNGAMTIGIVVHGSCITNGHGPGVTVLMTTAKKLIVPKMEESANIAEYLNIGTARKRSRAPQRRRRR